jgi:lipopolysaccharide export LptBFGC system permease protein LptF
LSEEIGETLEGDSVFEEKDFDATPQEIKKTKQTITEFSKKTQELQKKKAEELSEKEEKALSALPQISRNSNMFTRSRKKRGFQKKVIST